jgi:DNA polymerase-3 subunit alpha
MSKHFTHLHVHTEYSLLDGAIGVNNLVRYAKEQEWKAIGISDHGNIFGAVKFFQTAQKEGIKPVLGCEMYLCPDVTIKDVNERYYHLIVIVKNETGYKNLCRLMAFAYKEGYYFKPRIDYAILKKYSEGLIVTTACLGGHIPKLLRRGKEEEAYKWTEWMLDVFGPERFFLELQPPEYEKQAKMNELLYDLSDKYSLQMMATSDAHYMHCNDREAHEILLSVQTRALITDENRFTFGDARCHLRSTEEMLAAFPGREEAIWNTGKIADMCDFKFEFGKLFFPKFEVPQKHTQESFFKFLCRDGLEKLGNNGLFDTSQIEAYNERLDIEMNLIVEMGFIGYFLVVGDFIQWAKKEKIAVGPGRGSAAGSLVAWTLGITNVDPIKYNLLFERFLNPERVTMPDIDIDFCIERREDVINYVRDKYGHECVCQIITFGTMMAKGVLKDVARVLGFPFKDAAAITDLIPDQLKITINEAMEQEPRIQEMIDSNPKVKHLFDISKTLEGLTRHASKHAAGVVIAPGPLEELLPLYVPGKTNDLVAQYAMTELEAVGFLKMDFLGLKNLTLIEQCTKAIKKNHGVEIDLDKLPLDDDKTLQLLRDGKSDGIFQFESDGIKDVLRKLQPDKFEELIAVNALYRPGPLGSGMVDDFISRRHGRTKTTYMFPELEPILAETYGVIVYQEQVMKIAATIAGFSLGASDILRRAMGKKKASVMEEQKVKFIAGALENGFDKRKAGELFDLMAYFAGYGFNKSHSTAYALIAYQTAYLKAHYPHEFMAALVSFETNNPDKLTHYLQSIAEMGIVTQPPNINKSEIAFAAQNDTILFGLQGIKNVGEAALINIIEERAKKPFYDLLDFCTRIDLRIANKRIIESLIGTGAMDCLAGNRAQKTAELERVISQALENRKAALTGQTSMFSKPKSTSGDPEPYEFAPLDEWPDKKKLEIEKELAGFYLSSHPLKAYDSTLRYFTTTSFADGLALVTEKRMRSEVTISACGLLQSYRVITTKKGDRMAFGNFEDLSGDCELIIFPKTFKKVEEDLADYTVFIIKGVIDNESSTKCKIKVSELIPLEKVFETKDAIAGVSITMPTTFDEATCHDIQKLCTDGKKKMSLRIVFEENGTKLQTCATASVTLTQERCEAIEKLGGKVSCIV